MLEVRWSSILVICIRFRLFCFLFHPSIAGLQTKKFKTSEGVVFVEYHGVSGEPFNFFIFTFFILFCRRILYTNIIYGYGIRFSSFENTLCPFTLESLENLNDGAKEFREAALNFVCYFAPMECEQQNSLSEHYLLDPFGPENERLTGITFVFCSAFAFCFSKNEEMKKYIR